MASGKYNSKVRARGLDGTGVTEDVARKMHAAVGSGKAWVGIVEIEPVRQINEGSGDHAVECTLGFVEVAEPGSRAEDVLRELSRALYRDRRTAAGELPGTEAGGERSTEEVATAAEALVERDNEGTPTGTWDGSMDDEPSEPAEPGEEHEPQLAGEGAADPAYEPHVYLPGTTDADMCAMSNCGMPAESPVHNVPAGVGG